MPKSRQPQEGLLVPVGRELEPRAEPGCGAGSGGEHPAQDSPQGEPTDKMNCPRGPHRLSDPPAQGTPDSWCCWRPLRRRKWAGRGETASRAYIVGSGIVSSKLGLPTPLISGPRHPIAGENCSLRRPLFVCPFCREAAEWRVAPLRCSLLGCEMRTFIPTALVHSRDV